jgi:hypothetical protein
MPVKISHFVAWTSVTALRAYTPALAGGVIFKEFKLSNWSLPHTFQYQGREVKYGIKGEGEPLILVHGTPWSSFNLRHLIRDLASHYKVYYLICLGMENQIKVKQMFLLEYRINY